MADSFVPILGDFPKLNEKVAKGEFPYDSITDMVKKTPTSKVVLQMQGTEPKLFIHDIEFAQEFQDLIGTKVDRGFTLLFKIMFYWLDKSWITANIKTNSESRKQALKDHLGISEVSKYIPMFVEECEKSVKEWHETEGPIEMVHATKKFIFSVFVRMLFGDNAMEEFGTVEMEDLKTFEKDQYSLTEGWRKLVTDSINVKNDPAALLFPELIKLGLGKVNKAKQRNIDNFMAGLDKYIKNHSPKDSLYHALNKPGVTDHEGAVQDILGVMFLSMDSVSTIVTQIIYRLKKHPEITKKLQDELAYHIPDLGNDPKTFAKSLNVETLDQLEYLHYFIKECLRT